MFARLAPVWQECAWFSENSAVESAANLMETPSPPPKKKGAPFWGPLALAAGFFLGAMAHGSGYAALTPFTDALGTIWVQALQLVVIPLSVSLIVTGLQVIPSGKEMGKWGFASLAVFAGLLLGAAALALGIGLPYIHAFGPEPTLAARIEPSAAAPPADFSIWFESLVPRNFFASLASGDLLPIIVVSMLFGGTIRGLSDESRTLLVKFFSAIREACIAYVRYVVVLLPLGAFCLAYSFASESGIAVAYSALNFVLFVFGILILYLLLMLIVASWAGRLRLRAVLRELWPALEIAIGSRSSLATLPTLVEGARNLDLPEPARAAVLPLAGAVLKANRPLSAVAKLLFVATLYGITLDTARIVTFLATIFVLSVATPGIPSNSSSISLGAYLAAGLPLEGVVLFDATDPLTDIPKTAVNTTGYFASSVLASRVAGSSDEPSCALQEA